jgi:hypothetical protein
MKQDQLNLVDENNSNIQQVYTKIQSLVLYQDTTLALSTKIADTTNINSLKTTNAKEIESLKDENAEIKLKCKFLEDKCKQLQIKLDLSLKTQTELHKKYHKINENSQSQQHHDHIKNENFKFDFNAKNESSNSSTGSDENNSKNKAEPKAELHPPLRVRLQKLNEKSVALKWNHNPKNNLVHLTGYNIYINDELCAELNPEDQIASINGLQDEGEYRIYIKSCCGKHSESESSNLVVTRVKRKQKSKGSANLHDLNDSQNTNQDNIDKKRLSKENDDSKSPNKENKNLNNSGNTSITNNTEPKSHTFIEDFDEFKYQLKNSTESVKSSVVSKECFYFSNQSNSSNLDQTASKKALAPTDSSNIISSSSSFQLALYNNNNEANQVVGPHTSASVMMNKSHSKKNSSDLSLVDFLNSAKYSNSEPGSSTTNTNTNNGRNSFLRQSYNWNDSDDEISGES